MRGRELAGLLAVLTVVSMVAPVAMLTAPAAAQAAGNGQGGPPTHAGPPGHAGIPQSSVDVRGPPGGLPDGVPAHAAAWGVHASEHAAAMSATITVQQGDVVMQLTDNQNHDGREVSVNATAVEAALGYRPATVYGEGEDGGEWSSRVWYRDGSAIIQVPHFSTQTVTWSGEVSITATPATNGSSYSYDINDLDAASNLTINVTGHTATETDTELGTVDVGNSAGISVGGNLDPTGPASGPSPELTVSVDRGAVLTNPANAGLSDQYDETVFDSTAGGEILVNSSASSVSAVTVKFAVLDSADVVDVYVTDEDGGDSAHTEGTLVYSNWSASSSVSSTTNVTIPFNQTVSTTDGEVTVQFDPVSVGSAAKIRRNGTFVGPPSYIYHAGSKQSYAPFVWAHGGSLSSVSASSDDGTNASFGTVSIGSPQSTAYNVSTSATTLSLSASESSGSLAYNLTLTERTQTVDPAVEINGNTSSYSGTLADGETVTLPSDTAWLKSGTNRVNVTVGDGTLSADSPAPAVDLDYSHDAEDKQSVDYSGQKWSERYNISKTYASDRNNANVSIPFAGNVVRVRDIEYTINGGSWADIGSGSYTLDGTTLTADLGDMSAGDTVYVRANGSKVAVNNGSINVLDPTDPGSRLDSQIEIESWGSDSYIATGGTDDGNRIHYTYNESWSDANEDMRVTASEHRLRLPNAGAGSTARVSTIPVEVAPKAGDVVVSVSDPRTTEPKWHVEPGDHVGDEVEYTFVSAQDGGEYELVNTEGTVRDRGTASSPLTLLDDNDNEETLYFNLVNSTATSSDGGGTAMGPMPVDSDTVPLTILAVIAGFIALFVVQWYVTDEAVGVVSFGRRLVSPIVGTWPGRIVASIIGLVVALWAGLLQVPQQALILGVAAGSLLAAYVILRELGRFSMPVYAVLVIVIAVPTWSAVSGQSLIPYVGQTIQQYGAILIVAVGGLGYLWLRQRSGPTEVNRIVIGSESDSGGGSSD